MFNLKKVVLAAALVLATGAAQAATETFSFTGGSNHYSTAEAFTSVSGDRSLVARPGSSSGGDVRLGHFSNGLGVCNGNEARYTRRGNYYCTSPQHTLDGTGASERISFDLGAGVQGTITQIVFADYGHPDRFDIRSGVGNAYNEHFYGGDTWNGSIEIGSWFSVVARRDGMRAKIMSITVDYAPSEVPLPAAGFLLLGGLGGLALMKRRKS